MSIREKDLYERVRAALEASFAAIGKKAVCETGATKGLGEKMKALIPPGNDIVFRFLNRRPDIVGYVEKEEWTNTLFIAEVKHGSLTIQAIYQAKMYKELLGATFGFLISMQPIAEELKRLLRRIPIILGSAGDHTFHFLALGRFDLESGTFADWFANRWQEGDPFNHLKSLAF